MLLHELVASGVTRFPDAVALEVAGERVTYAELWSESEAWARAVAPELGGTRRVCLVTPRVRSGYAAYLGILRAGAELVPVSPAAPAGRVAALLDATRPCLAVAPAELSGVRSLASPQSGRGSEPPAPSPESIAYILFTSGSTGRPKGVPISHANAVSFVEFASKLDGRGPDSRVSQIFEFTFDPSVLDLFATWATGGTLVVPDAPDLFEPVAWVRRAAITHWTSVPTTVNMAFAAGQLDPPARMPSLRHSSFCGEPLTFELARAWRACAPNSLMTNVYGPTEVTVAQSHFPLPDDPADWAPTANGTVPIGKVWDHLDWLIHPVADGADGEGELCLRGPQRFGGYLDPADDAGRFIRADGTPYTGEGAPLSAADWYRTGDLVRDLGEGSLLHLGRVDKQVKVRGYRVEIGEIEAALCRLPEIHHAVVVARRLAIGRTELVAFCVGEQQPARAIRRALADTLPAYMLPEHVAWIDDLPVTATGKVDRRRLELETAATGGRRVRS
jgi:amino acid adenylation domain-containing protein